MSRTLQAVRQGLFAALTTPLLQYQINAGATLTVPLANIVPKQPWNSGGLQAPSPLVCLAVAGSGSVARRLPDRIITASIWVVSSASSDEVTEIYEAIRARIHTGDQDAVFGSDFSRSATLQTLPLVIRKCEESRVSPPDFEPTTQRYYLMAEYSIVAI